METDSAKLRLPSAFFCGSFSDAHRLNYASYILRRAFLIISEKPILKRIHSEDQFWLLRESTHAYSPTLINSLKYTYLFIFFLYSLAALGYMDFVQKFRSLSCSSSQWLSSDLRFVPFPHLQIILVDVMACVIIILA